MKSVETYLHDIQDELCDKIVYHWEDDQRFANQREMQQYNYGIAEAMEIIRNVLDGREFKSPLLQSMKEWFTWQIGRGDIVNKQEKEILKYLEQSYSGAKMMDDESCQIRLARAIAAFNSDPEVSAFALFTNKFITEYCTEWGDINGIRL